MIVIQILDVTLNLMSIGMMVMLVLMILVIVVPDVLTQRLSVMITTLAHLTIVIQRKDVFTTTLIAMIRMIVLKILAAPFTDANTNI
jgi:hypothetical protein